MAIRQTGAAHCPPDIVTIMMLYAVPSVKNSKQVIQVMHVNPLFKTVLSNYTKV